MASIDETSEFSELIERSSLGTDGARRLRARTPQSRAELVGQIVRHRDQLATCRKAGDRDGALQALAALAETYHTLGRDDEALALGPDPDAVRHEANATDRAWSLAVLAAIRYALGREDEGHALLQDALVAGHEVADPAGQAQAFTSLASASQAMGHIEQALSLRMEVQRWTERRNRDKHSTERPDPRAAQTAAEFMKTLRQYRIWAGTSYRAIAQLFPGKIAVSTLRALLLRDKLPPLPVVLAVITGCGGGEEDQRRFTAAWRGLLLEEKGHLAPSNPPVKKSEAVREVPHDGQPRARPEAASEEPSLVAGDAYEESILAADLPYAAKAAAIRDHRELIREVLAGLGIGEVPEFIRRAVRASVGEEAAGADRDAG